MSAVVPYLLDDAETNWQGWLTLVSYLEAWFPSDGDSIVDIGTSVAARNTMVNMLSV